MVLVKEEEDVPVLVVVQQGGGEAAVEEEEVVHLVVLLLLRRLHLLHLLHLLRCLHLLHLLHVLLWPQASAAKILPPYRYKDNFCLQCKRFPIMRVTRIPHLQELLNNLLVLHMFLTRLKLELMLLA
jgi:hypothetical protein